MKLLLVILAVMTWTVKDKNNVSLSDDSTVPYDIEVSYTNTYNKGHVRAGDVATLNLTNLGGITVEKISLAMRSTQGAGAGTVTVVADNTQLANTTVTWQNVSSDVQVFAGQKQNVRALTIIVTGSQNSLYVDAFTITYAPRPAYTVTLMNGNRIYTTMTEPSGMHGVVLPGLPDTAQWHFIGWCEMELWSAHTLPQLYPANKKFYPEANCTLWATYQFNDTPEQVYATELESGTYLYVNREAEIALTGIPQNGRMEFDILDASEQNQYYDITFASPDTAFITHHSTGTPIGYSGTSMASTPSPWLVYHNDEETIFYIIVNNRNYVLWLNIMSGDGSEFYAGLKQAIPNNSPLALLLPQLEDNNPLITCHPESPQSIEEVTSDGLQVTGERVLMRFGNYDLMIKDGQKYLRKR